MQIKLNQPFAANSAADSFDVKQMKKALNRLGYYRPYEKVGITGIPDSGVFDALKKFQEDHTMPGTGRAKPGDETIQKINQEAAKPKEGYYIWRTAEDEKVRPAHAELNGTRRDWSDSPDPGEEFNCRCWAEPIKEVPELVQMLVSEIKDASHQWDDIDFIRHFYFGGGKEKTLSEIGLFGQVIKHAEEIMFDRVKAQVAREAIARKSGSFTGDWSNSYDFKPVVYSFGSVTIKGRFKGAAKEVGDIIQIEAAVQYEFYDEFTDPVSVREVIFGTSLTGKLPDTLTGDVALFVTDMAGNAFEIVGVWNTEITGTVKNPHAKK